MTKTIYLVSNRKWTLDSLDQDATGLLSPYRLFNNKADAENWVRDLGEDENYRPFGILTPLELEGITNNS